MQTREELILEYQWLVSRIAISVGKRLPAESYEMEDLMGYGQIGLIDAATGYRAEQGEFATYAFLRIRGSIIDGLRESGKFPRQLYEIRKRILEHTEELTSTLGRFPEPDEVAERAGMSCDEYRVWDGRIKQMDHAAWGTNHSQEMLEGLPDVVDSFSCTDMQGDVMAALCRIPRRERYVLYATYWLCMGNDDIARQLGVKPYRVAKIRQSGLERLKDYLSNYKGE